MNGSMTIQRILQLVLVAIVLMIAFSLLSLLLRIGVALLEFVLPVLVLLLVVAVVLRFIELLAKRRR